MSIFAGNVPLVSLIFFVRSLVFPILLFFSNISLHGLLTLHVKAFLSLFAILWNFTFSWVYLFCSPLPFTSPPFLAICKPSSGNHFAFLHFFFFGMVLVTASYTVVQTSVHSSSGTLSVRYNPLNLLVTSTIITRDLIYVIPEGQSLIMSDSATPCTAAHQSCLPFTILEFAQTHVLPSR